MKRNRWILYLVIGVVLAGFSWESISGEVARGILVAALLFAFHDYFGHVFQSLYYQILKRLEISDQLILGSPTTASSILVTIEIAIATPLVVSSQYQDRIIELIVLSVAGTLMLGTLSIAAILQVKYLLIPVVKNIAKCKYIVRFGRIYFVILIPSVLHLVRYLPDQMPPWNLPTGISLLIVGLLMIAVFVMVFIIVSILSILLYSILSFIIPFTAPFDSSLSFPLDWWAFGSLILIYSLLIVYHWPSIVAMVEELFNHIQSTTE